MPDGPSVDGLHLVEGCVHGACSAQLAVCPPTQGTLIANQLCCVPVQVIMAAILLPLAGLPRAVAVAVRSSFIFACSLLTRHCGACSVLSSSSR
eukprot:2053114-Amphidinium_carterae.1